MNDFEQKKKEILSGYNQEIKDSIKRILCQQDYALEVDASIARITANPYMTNVLTVILDYYKSNFGRGTMDGGYISVTISDIRNILRISTGTISTSINKFARAGILDIHKENSNQGNFNYYKPDLGLLDFLRFEDIVAWHTCILNEIPPTPNEMDKRCPTVAAVRNMLNKTNNDELFSGIAKFVKSNPHLTTWFERCIKINKYNRN